MVVLAGALDGGRHAALVELKTVGAEGGSLSAGSPDGPRLTVLPCPTIPADAA